MTSFRPITISRWGWGAALALCAVGGVASAGRLEVLGLLVTATGAVLEKEAAGSGPDLMPPITEIADGEARLADDDRTTIIPLPPPDEEMPVDDGITPLPPVEEEEIAPALPGNLPSGEVQRLDGLTSDDVERLDELADDDLPQPIDKSKSVLPPHTRSAEERIVDAQALNPNAWWTPLIARPLRDPHPVREITLRETLMEALLHSEYVQSISLQPLIQETEIARAQADFDPVAFLESKWSDLNDPVGNTLTTGGAPRFLDSQMNNRLGMRRKMLTGGVLEFSQDANLRDTNSVFFQPTNQALTQMSLNYTQPLLRGAGTCYNQSVIVLAEIDTRASARDVQRQLQDHLFRVVQAYWDLCLERSLYIQRLRSRDRAMEIQRELDLRKDFDVVSSQLLRSQAVVAARTASLARAEAGMRNAETRLRMLTNSPVLSNQDNLELLPQELPLQHFQPTELMAELQLAVQHRAEIDVTLDKIRSSEVRLGIAHNDLKPQLNLIVESYVKGLKGDYAMLSSLGGQFSDGTPSYAAGLAYEGALGNRAAQAKVRKRTLELHQLMHDFRNVMQTVSGEVEIAAREREAAYREVLGHQRAVVAQDAEVCYLLARWRELPGHDRSAALILEDALNAQDRLTQAEASLAQSQRDFSLAVANLRRATGTLLDTKPARFCAPPQESGKWSQAATMPTSAKPSAAAATRPAVQAPARAASDRTASKPSDQFVPLGLQPPTTTAQRPTGGDYRRN